MDDDYVQAELKRCQEMEGGASFCKFNYFEENDGAGNLLDMVKLAGAGVSTK
jgi:hypothetical protein